MMQRKWLALFIVLAALAAVSIWLSHKDRDAGRMVLIRRPQAIMGTDCTMAAVVKGISQQDADHALVEAERTLRTIEAKMSTWIADSEVSALNRNMKATLSPESLLVLQTAQQAYHETQGAFDITKRPVFELWRQAGKNHKRPTEDEVERALAQSNWDAIQLHETGAKKTLATARVDLGGIAKGYGIDRALATLQQNGVPAGLVDIGGDLACFRPEDDPQTWRVDIRNPFSDGILLSIRFHQGAVCTSGNYERFAEIEGKRYSHIIDPRTGWPAQAAPSVTVLADSALTADIWATALSVLGEDGIALLPEGIETLMVLGDKDNFELLATEGFAQLIQGTPPKEIRTWKPKN